MKISILASIRTGKTFKYVSAFMALNILLQCISPTVALALTSGPGQEEFASFEPATTTDMVDLYSGDFNYNIPLLSVPGPNGGYPINLAYHSGIGVEQEASWAGLGWNVNVGAINRQLRGLPDDFKGDPIDQKMNLKQNTTVMLNYTPGRKEKYFGIPRPNKEDSPVSMSYQMYYNTYKGLGSRVFASISPDLKNSVAGVGLGLSFDSQEGIGIEANMSLSAQHNKSGLNFGAGVSYNSRSGVEGFSFSSGFTASKGIREYTKSNGKYQTKLAGTMGYSSTSSLSFSTNQSVPSVSIPMRTDTYPFDIKFKTPLPNWTFGKFNYRAPLAWTGSVANSKVAHGGELTTSAYGYLYTGEHEADGTTMRDFQRAPISYSKKVPYLAPSSFTYDLYTQTGQGAGGMFRPYYSSIGRLSSPKVKSEEVQNRLNLEGGGGPDVAVNTFDFHTCFGGTQVEGSSTSKGWYENNDLSTRLEFGTTNGAIDYEPFYFKQYGEKSGVLLSDDELEKKWGGDQAIRVKLEKIGSWPNKEFKATNDFIRNQPEASNVLVSAGLDQRFRKQRLPRASNVEMLTDDQAAIYGGKQDQYGYTGTTPNKTFNHHHKISEVSILQTDGMRYTYGLPAYNNFQTEAVFAVDGSNTELNTNNIPVPNDGTNIIPSSANGSDEYLSQTSMTTPYAHSWLLTSVVSADYIDLTGDGPTSDDFGYWVKFNYLKTASNYKWRVPYSGANYMEGNREEDSDDKGSFTYGEKEIYFLASVETKTHIAIFQTGQRFDCVQATGKYAVKEGNADATNNPMQCLQNIKLYAKNGFSGHNVVPIKTVNFTYSYRLCQQTENATKNAVNLNKGKLTLDKVSFTYQNSDRGELSAYKFKYGDAVPSGFSTDNPKYDLDNMDRWGNYKNNSGQGSYPYKEFPYTDQKEDSPPDVAKWSLTQIDLPTGGAIKINYESDDYGYVEDKKATHMFDIMGIGPVPFEVSKRTDSQPKFAATERNNNDNFRVYFKLDKDISTLGDNDKKQAYVEGHLKDIDKIYFKIYAELTPEKYDPITSTLIPAKYDYVTGYADVVGTGPINIGWSQIGGIGSGLEIIGFVNVKGVNLKKHAIAAKKVNPFTKAAIQHLRISRPELIYNASGSKDPKAKNQIINLIGSVGKNFDDMMSMLQGFNTWAYSKSFGQRIQLSGRSVIRLNDPDGIKYGGGVRVAKIAISDNWDASSQDVRATASGAKEYGQKYDYRIQEEGRTISSGVAYEPQVGGDECALRTPVDYEESILLGTTNSLYVDNPILEQYYPGASVGYRKVTVTSIGSDQADLSDNNQVDGSYKIERTATPITIYEFYTAKDFPVITDETDLSADPAILQPILIPGIYSSFKKRMARSQGYSVIINDAAGKMKSITLRTKPTLLNLEGVLISKEEYIYNTDAPYSDTRRNCLSNKVQVLTVDANHQTVYQTGIIGQSHDVFVDENVNSQESAGYGMDLNFTLKVITSPPYGFVPVIVPLPYASETETSLSTIVTMKVITRSAILKKVITTTSESVITKESLAFDLETGKPLLTKVTNEFKDAVYQLAYPAHWYYPNMGGAYKNYGITVTTFVSNLPTFGWLQITSNINVNKYFNVGDELLVNNLSKAHITQIDGVNNYIRMVNRDGGYVSSEISSVKVITSGKKNLLDAETGKVLCQEVPYFSETIQNDPAIYSVNKIVDASAIEYKDQWRTMCKNCNLIPNLNDPQDPYTTGERGLWRPFTSYAYKTDRVYTNERSREDGVYADFTQFPWFKPSQKSAKWIAANTITEYSPYGFELENQNAIGIYSSALYGYNQSSPVAIAKNAQFKELLFDGFEDYFSGNCMDHFGMPYRDNLTLIEKHTGKTSVRVEPGQKVAIEANLKNCAR
jgi:hypothetical protein